METHIGKSLRLSDVIDSRDQHALWLDTTLPSSVGAVLDLEDLRKTISEANEFCDGIIVNPGQAEHLADLLGGKKRASPIVRVDWTNAFRDQESFLPVANVKRVEISNGPDVLHLGGSAAVATLFLGFDEEFEASNIRSISRLCRECYPLALPVVVDIQPIGAKVSNVNFEDVVKLGVSFMMEAGADVIVIPECETETLQVIAKWATVPVLVRVDTTPAAERLRWLLGSGFAGIMLTGSAVAEKDYLVKIAGIFELIHEMPNVGSRIAHDAK